MITEQTEEFQLIIIAQGPTHNFTFGKEAMLIAYQTNAAV